jgi:hypothetical protein
MPVTWLWISAPNAFDVADDYRDIGDRFVRAAPGYEKVMSLLEDEHKRFFARLGGRYVRTGATLESLTQRMAPGAVRQLHNDGMRFGTLVPWAHFLTKSPHDPEHGQIMKGRSAESRKGAGKRSAVVVFPKPLRREIAKEVLTWAVEGR